MIPTAITPKAIYLAEITQAEIHTHLAFDHFSTGFYVLAPTPGLIEPTSATIKVQYTCAQAPVDVLVELNHVGELCVIGVAFIQFGYLVVHVCSFRRWKAVATQPVITTAFRAYR